MSIFQAEGQDNLYDTFSMVSGFSGAIFSGHLPVTLGKLLVWTKVDAGRIALRSR